MNKIAAVKVSVIAISVMLFMGCSSTYQSKAPQVSPDGMTLKKATRSTLAYKKEEVDFSQYTSILILPSQVAFKKNWKRDYNRDQVGLSTRVSDADVIRIKEDVAKLFDEVFQAEFSQNANSPLVQKPTVGTLVVKPAVINLDVNAPDTVSATNMKSYTSETGEATLFLELYDGVSGEILVRVFDSETAGDDSYYQWATRVSNRADAKRLIKKWAKALHNKFEQVQNP
ncbi:DUF3313 domain-containing protein [Colwellia sp. D2M02]|uniref:DUF3313 family protein n=1 Tax=Colwellia sp. D2M02 TaxID=2841562 RepID=UPI001C08B119|nr:DUF3313 family protein [Colwellia sp. D2M02]MBU2893458.1 DUF3313 domain-containing protein [Colwellia sp. D2M02]